MNLDYGYFRLAKRASLESICYPKVGAVISTKRPLSFGFNKPKTHPTYANPEDTLRATIHAEMDCIRTITWDDFLEGATIWVYREINHVPALARPCEECIEMLESFSVRKMIYTIDEPPYYKIERIK